MLPPVIISSLMQLWKTTTMKTDPAAAAQAFSRGTFSFSRKCYGEYSQQTVGIPINIACLIQILISNMLNSDRQLIERRRDIFFTF